MSALKAAVSQGLSGQGVGVLDDRGGLSVRDLDPELPISIWVDETERVIRAEAPLCYPIDDCSPDLAMALDHLNRVRAGVTYSYREANRALVVSSSWTSPNRSPSANQLHLLMTLLLEAKDRDGPGLWRVAEGDAGWDEVVADTGAHTTQTLRFSDTSGESTGGTGKFQRGASGAAGPGSGTEANRWSEMMQIADTGEDASSSRKWRDQSASGGMSGGGGRARRRTGRPTGKQAAPTGGLDALDEVPTRRLDQLEEEDASGYDPERPYDGATPKRLSRHALSAAVSSLDAEQHARQDMTAVYRRGSGGGWIKWVLAFGLLGGALFGGATYYESITGQSLVPDLSFFQDKLLSDSERKLKAREAIPPGKDLLVAELQDPLQGDAHAIMVQRALDALGDDAGDTLGSMLARSPSPDTRQQAYDLWIDNGFHDEDGALLRVLKLMVENKRTRTDEDTLLQGMLGLLRSSEPTDESVHIAFAWAVDDVWITLIEILGRPGEGAEERSKMLQEQLAKDPTAEKLALQALVKTGFPPQRAAVDLALANGAKWVRGPGRSMLLEIAERDLALFEPLLGLDKPELRLAAIDLLVASGLRESIALLVRVMRTDSSQDVRLRAVKALSELNVPEAVWPLALEINRTPKDEFETKLRTEALKALRKQPEAEVVRQIELHMGPERELKERLWAVLALGQLETPAAVLALLEIGLRDPDERLRRRVIKTLREHKEGSRTTLQRGLSVLRDVGRNDPSESVRAEANALYQELIRR